MDLIKQNKREFAAGFERTGFTGLTELTIEGSKTCQYKDKYHIDIQII